mmetsp:Transcript_1353/g.1743  ORF Transcript_1353/g.1743 Transcript_1353/m.1743 type:complete len:121 (-) Transcript_1353:255-617(-)
MARVPRDAFEDGEEEVDDDSEDCDAVDLARGGGGGGSVWCLDASGGHSEGFEESVADLAGDREKAVEGGEDSLGEEDGEGGDKEDGCGGGDCAGERAGEENWEGAGHDAGGEEGGDEAFF